jgi:hypothetical protein
MNDPHLPELSSEELANRLDEVLGSDETQSIVAQPNDPRIDIAVTFANARHPEMSPEMLARIQSKVVAAHRQQLRPQRTYRPQVAMTLRWATAAAVVLIFCGAAAMPSVASSVPGELWYPVKRNLENVEILFASSSVSRAEVHLTQAERSINEVQTLLQQRVFDANLMIDARHSLADFENVAADLLPREESRAAWVSESIAILLQDAQQMGIISEAEVVALLPTVIPISTEAPTSTPTVVISPTATTTNTLIPTASPTAVVSASLTSSPLPTTVEPVATDTEEPSPTVTDTVTYTPTASNTPLPTATATSVAPVTTMYVVEKANVRQQPARNQAIIAVIEQGTAVEVIGEDDTNSWWNVKLQDGRTGWVANFLLSNELPAPSVGNDSSNSGDFGCEHPGDYCNAPGQTGSQPTPPGGGPPDNPPGGGPPQNPPGGGPPSNPGNGNGGKP